MSQEGSKKKVAPFLSVTKKVSPNEADFLDFLRLRWYSPSLSTEYGDGLSAFFFDRLSTLMKEKNAMCDAGAYGKEFDEICYEITTMEQFKVKWTALMKSYKNRDEE